MKRIFLLITILSVVVAIYFYFKIDSENIVIVSDFGITTTLPEGWVVWEGPSSSYELLSDENFIKLILENKEFNSQDVLNKVEFYQDKVNSWRAESSDVLILTRNNPDYRKRDLSYSGKMHSRVIDSEEIFEPESITLFFQGVDFFTEDNESVDIIERNINDRQVSFLRTKDHYDIVEWILVSYPIDSNAVIDGQKIKFVVFSKYIEKGNDEKFNEFVEFVSKIKIDG